MLLQTRPRNNSSPVKTVITLPNKEGEQYGMAIVLYLMYSSKETLLFKVDGEICDPLTFIGKSNIPVRWIPPQDYELSCDWFDLINLSRQQVVFKRFTFALANRFNEDWLLCHTDDVNVLYGMKKACEHLKISTSRIVMRMYDNLTALI